MTDEEILLKLQEFTHREIEKYHKSGKSYLFDTKVTEDGFKIGCILITGSRHSHNLYDLTKRVIVYDNLYNKSLAISMAIDYNRHDYRNIQQALQYDLNQQSIKFELKQCKYLYKNTDVPHRKEIYYNKILEGETRLHRIELQIKNHFSNRTLHK